MTRVQKYWPWWRLVITGLNSLALVLSVMLSWHYLMGGSMIGCGGGSPCEQVLNSRWSVLAGIFPISGLAVGVYLAFLVAGLFTDPDTELQIRRLAWSIMLVLSGIITGSAIWFTVLQKWVIGDFCPWCMTAHITGLLLSVTVIWRSVRETNSIPAGKIQKNKMKSIKIPPASSGKIIPPKKITGFVLAGLVLAGTMAAFQVLFSAPPVSQGDESQSDMPVLDYHSVPLVGSPDAPQIVSVLFDYNCSHCQKIHFMLEEAVRRYNGKLAFALCPAPLNSSCNQYIPRDAQAFKSSCELAETALAVWLARPQAYAVFENWMFSFDSGDFWLPRSTEASRAKAAELVGKDAFDKALADPWIDEYIEACVQIYGQTLSSGMGGIPKLIFGPKWVIPQPESADELISILQENLGVPMF